MARQQKQGGRGEQPRSPMPMPTPGARTSPRQFVSESYGELRKVQWPTARHTLIGTVVVGIFTAFFAVFLTVSDLVIKPATDFLMGR